jgi:hypothetical protein
VTADPELGEALARVRAATGTREPDATLLRRLAVEGAEAELEAGRNRRTAAEALFEAMDTPRPGCRLAENPAHAISCYLSPGVLDSASADESSFTLE